jgi:LEA14-like dessication related protein
VAVLDVRLDRLEGPDAWFVANVELANPNDREVALDALDATLAIEEQPVAQAALVRPVTLPPLGKANAEIAARTGVDHLLRAIASAMRRLGSERGPAMAPSLRYRLEGTARLQGGLRVPFRRSGELGSRPGGAS